MDTEKDLKETDSIDDAENENNENMLESQEDGGIGEELEAEQSDEEDSSYESNDVEQQNSIDISPKNAANSSAKKKAQAIVMKKDGTLRTVARSGMAENKVNIEHFNAIQRNFKQKTLRNRVMLNRILGMVKRGNNSASQHNILESLKIDDDWLVNIEGHINHLDNIIRNPKSALKEERIIVNTSKAKRTDSETIRYLSSHTSDIEAIHGEEIRPARLNVREIDSDICTYENRFVYALMVRLRSFLEQRYTAIKDQINCFDTNELKVNSKVETPNGEFEYNLSIKLKDKMSDSVAVKENASLLERIESCRMHISALMGSDFARTVAKAKLLMPPINKTNAIRGHTDYRGCYNLWLFLSSYTAVGYSIRVEEQNLELTNDYYDDLAFIVSMSVKNMMDNNMINRSIFGVGEIKKRIKRFKPIKSFTYTPVKHTAVSQPGAELVNQFYFDKIKQLLKESESVKRQKDEPLRLSFRSYYKSVNTLNNKLYDEALELDKYRTPVKSIATIDGKQEDLNLFEEGLKRLKLLRSLKENDFKAIEREEKKMEERVAKLRVQIRELKEKERQEALERALEKQRQQLVRQEERRLAAIEKQRLLQEKKERDKAERLEKQKQRQEEKERAAAEKILQKREAEKEKLKAKQLAEKQLEKEKQKQQREEEKELAREKQRKLREYEKQQKKLEEKLNAYKTDDSKDE